MDRQPAHLVRKRVIQILQQASQRPLTVVCAGTGYGKTTAVKQFLAQQQCASLYITIKPVHNLAEALWLEFLAQMDAGYPAFAQKLRKIGAPIEITQFSAFVKVIQEMAAQYGCVYVVLDDFHLLHDAQTLRFVLLAVRNRLPGLKVFLVARVEPSLSIPQLEQEGLVSHVGAAQLAFQPDEIASFTAARAGKDNPGLVAHIHKQTDGWPLAVMLLYHTMSPGKSLDDSLQDVRPLVHNTMDKLFFRDYPQPIQRALVQLALCETIYPQLVEAIKDFNTKLLNELVAYNPFISVDERDRFRLHTLYQEFLQTKAAAVLSEAEICTHHNAVATWLRQNGHLFESISSYRMAKNYAAAWQVIISLLGPMPSRSFVNLCSEVYDETPREVFEQDGYILLNAALVLICSKQPRRARSLLENAAARYTRQTCTDAMLGEYHLLYGLSYFARYDIRFAGHWQKAHALLTAPSSLVDRRFRLLYITPLFAYKTLNPLDIKRFNNACGDALPLFMEMTGGCGAALYQNLLAEGCHYRGNHQQALRLFAQSVEIALEYEQFDVLVSAAFFSFQNYICLGQYQKAQLSYETIRRYSMLNTAGNVIHPLADAALAYIDVMLGKKTTVGLSVNGEDGERLLMYVRGLYAATIMQGLCESADTHMQALQFMQSIKEPLEKQHLHLPQGYILTMASYVSAQMGMESYSYLLLEEAYTATGDGQYSAGLMLGGAKTMQAVQRYRAKPQPLIPAEWLDRTYQSAYRWVQNTGAMAEYQSGLATPPNG